MMGGLWALVVLAGCAGSSVAPPADAEDHSPRAADRGPDGVAAVEVPQTVEAPPAGPQYVAKVAFAWQPSRPAQPGTAVITARTRLPDDVERAAGATVRVGCVVDGDVVRETVPAFVDEGSSPGEFEIHGVRAFATPVVRGAAPCEIEFSVGGPERLQPIGVACWDGNATRIGRCPGLAHASATAAFEAITLAKADPEGGWNGIAVDALVRHGTVLDAAVVTAVAACPFAGRTYVEFADLPVTHGPFEAASGYATVLPIRLFGDAVYGAAPTDPRCTVGLASWDTASDTADPTPTVFGQWCVGDHEVSAGRCASTSARASASSSIATVDLVSIAFERPFEDSQERRVELEADITVPNPVPAGTSVGVRARCEQTTEPWIERSVVAKDELALLGAAQTLRVSPSLSGLSELPRRCELSFEAESDGGDVQILATVCIDGRTGRVQAC